MLKTDEQFFEKVLSLWLFHEFKVLLDVIENSNRLVVCCCLSCSCGNVNWARRMDCNVCNTPKFGTVEPRTGMLLKLANNEEVLRTFKPLLLFSKTAGVNSLIMYFLINLLSFSAGLAAFAHV